MNQPLFQISQFGSFFPKDQGWKFNKQMIWNHGPRCELIPGNFWQLPHPASDAARAGDEATETTPAADGATGVMGRAASGGLQERWANATELNPPKIKKNKKI